MTPQDLNQSLLGGNTFYLEMPNARRRRYVIPTQKQIAANSKGNSAKESCWEVYVPLKDGKSWYRESIIKINANRQQLQAIGSVLTKTVCETLDTAWFKQCSKPPVTWSDEWDENSEAKKK